MMELEEHLVRLEALQTSIDLFADVPDVRERLGQLYIEHLEGVRRAYCVEMYVQFSEWYKRTFGVDAL